MKCPYHDCQKDFNPKWGTESSHVYPTMNSIDGDGLWVETAECKFCNRQFHQIFRSKKVLEEGKRLPDTHKCELLFTFPSVKTAFVTKTLPVMIKGYFNEAERCRSIGSITGSGACLRKTVYAICDDKKTTGNDYKEKISNLDVKGKYQELLKQIKWLGDNTTKPGDEKYTLADVDLALEILPLLVEELYLKDEKIDEVEKVLSKVRTRTRKS